MLELLGPLRDGRLEGSLYELDSGKWRIHSESKSNPSSALPPSYSTSQNKPVERVSEQKCVKRVNN